MFYFFFLQKAENNRLKKPVGQHFFLFKVGSVGSVDQQVNYVLP